MGHELIKWVGGGLASAVHRLKIVRKNGLGWSVTVSRREEVKKAQPKRSSRTFNVQRGPTLPLHESDYCFLIYFNAGQTALFLDEGAFVHYKWRVLVGYIPLASIATLKGQAPEPAPYINCTFE
ncbi:hypothetical protein PIB30_092416 [Stylosanthes scabra]|uniref:Uncharacterized protein n=1 Tax=Stylosanthes scabra TaxID=79078 RepID=A0ABU6UU55_9FABA|nr:hypothetical protein [Stylosanthes scabra]